MSKKNLIAFYSHTGNTRHVAEQIASQLDGILHEILPEQEYSKIHNEVEKQSQKEINAGYKPPLKSKFSDDVDFDVLFIGSPNWFNTIAPPVSSFLDGLNLSGKTVIPFITHGGGGLARCAGDITSLCPGANVRDALTVYDGGEREIEAKITSWLKKFQ